MSAAPLEGSASAPFICLLQALYFYQIPVTCQGYFSKSLEFSAVKIVAFLQNLMGLCGEFLSDACHKNQAATFPPLKPPTAGPTGS